MTETPALHLLKAEQNGDILHRETDAMRAQLRDMKRQLIGLLTTVERVLGDEPSVMSRAERRRG